MSAALLFTASYAAGVAKVAMNPTHENPMEALNPAKGAMEYAKPDLAPLKMNVGNDIFKAACKAAKDAGIV